MKIDANKISFEGLIIEENIAAAALDLDTDIIKFKKPLKVKADIYKITNALNVDLTLDTAMAITCSRCLQEFEIEINKNLKLNYPVNKLEPMIDLNADIREEIILDYPIQPLCSPDCQGLCLKCGKNLNQGGCSCGTT